MVKPPPAARVLSPQDRDLALRLSTGWFSEIREHAENWVADDPDDPNRRALFVLLKRFVESCTGVAAMLRAEQEEQAGALLRIAIETLWVLDFFSSEHPEAMSLLASWIDGKQLQPATVRKLLAEEFGDGDENESVQHRWFLNMVYGELCVFVHPQPNASNGSVVERGLFVVFVSAFGFFPVFLSKFDIWIPQELLEDGYTLAAIVPVVLTSHLPETLRQQVLEFSAFLLEVADEAE